MSQSEYAKQHRGTRDAYESYFTGMDASMQQKVAVTTAYFPTSGRIADMGSGSGRGTYDLACLYANLELVGVDINPVSVARSQETYQAPNLSYLAGDIAEKVFPDESLDGILNSSVLHHVTSFNQFDVARVFTTFDHQVAQLKTGGVIIVRDFVIPDGPEKVWLDLPTNDGLSEGEIKGLSSAALFEHFARHWRSSLNPDAAVPYLKLTSPYPYWARFEVGLRTATEFVLRKDYRADWDTELLEEYTYLNQAEFEAAFRARGLRIINSMPIWNPWIVQNRFHNRFRLYDLAGSPIAFPPTNFLIAAEKVLASDGIELLERKQAALASPNFLSVRSYRHKFTRENFELVTRAKQTIDLIPWFENNGQIFILAKKDFPRPLVNACPDHPNLSGSTRSGYITEPITALIEEAESPNVAIHRVLQERAGIQAEDIILIGDPFDYFPSPGGLDERVLAWLVQIRPRFTKPFASPNYTKFTSAGIVRELDAGQTLRASHVGGMFDARMEINLYRLLRSLNRSVGTWIGAPIRLIEQAATIAPQEVLSVLSPASIEAFEVETTTPELKYLALREGSFSELNAEGQALAQAEFEYVIPREMSKNTVTALPVIKLKDGVFIALEQRDLPAPQNFTQNSRLAVVPAWRLPQTLQHLAEAPAFLRQRFRSEYGIGLQQAWELGGAYFPTPGVTPEIVYPFACEVEAADLAGSALLLVKLEEIIYQLALVEDAHTLIAIHRLAHALGFLP